MSKDENELDQIAKEIIMTATQTTNENVSKAQAAELEATLADLDFDSIEELETVSEVEDLDLAGEEDVVQEPEDEPAEAITADSITDDADIEELEMELDKAEAYASQESAAVGASADGSIQKEGTTVPRGSKSGTPRASTPRAPRDMASVPADVFVLTGDIAGYTDEQKEQAKKDVMAATPGQKKVAEKFENLFQSMAVGRVPSKYVMTAFGALDKAKTITSAELVAAFKTSGVGEGTARSQTGQIMALFPVVGIAERDGKTLKLKDASNVADYLRKHIAA